MPIALLQKSAPDNYDFMVFLLVLLCFLTILFFINSFIDWLRSKPWKRDIPPENGLPENELSRMNDPGPEERNPSNNFQLNGSVILKHT